MSGVWQKRSVASLLGALGTGPQLVRGNPETPVSSVSVDSRTVTAGALFVAIPGQRTDGALHVGSAWSAGAACVAVEPSAVEAAARVKPDGALIATAAPRRFAAEAAAELAGRPSGKMIVVAVTGTSGKTTTTYLLESIFRAAGYSTGVIGTIEYRYAAQHEAAPLTTPDSVALQELFARMVAAGVTHVAMEASSHALALDRLHRTACDAAVYTNLSRDHLDFHGDLESYAADKAKLFREVLPSSGKPNFAVLNGDDAEVMRLAPELSMPHVTFGERAEVRAEDVRYSLEGIEGTLVLGAERAAFSSQLIGSPHLANILAASATAWRLGIPTSSVVRGILACRGVPGRLEPVREGQDFAVVVDYAHKPDALERTLQSLRGLTTGRLIAVFGCGGDRDAGKRPLMGEIAARLADLVLLTSDNPRTEDPLSIIQAIESGVQATSCTRVAQEALGQRSGGEEYAVVPERRAAIKRAIAVARPGDLVLIAGKGHEDYQIVGSTKHHLDDREEARLALKGAA